MCAACLETVQSGTEKEDRPPDDSSCVEALCAVEHGTLRIARSGYRPQRIMLLSDS